MSIPGGANPLLLTSSSAAAGGYSIDRSLRFNSADSAYLSRTPASAGNLTTWTVSVWIKRASLGTNWFFNAGSSFTTLFGFNASDQLLLGEDANSYGRRTTAVYRDLSAWYHIVFVADTNNGTQADRFRIYVNGVRADDTNTGATASGATTTWNSNVAHAIGRYNPGPAYTNGYLADIYSIDGQALTPTSFGEFDDNGIWQPIAYSGSYGTNGFHLDFADNSTAAALGTDTSGNGNTWSVSNLNVLSSYTDTFLSRLPSGASWTNPTYAFDGTTANYADGTAGNGTVSTIRFNKPLTGVTLLEYFYDGTSTYGYNSTDVGTGPNLTGGSWVTVYSGTAITVNNVRCTSQPGNGVIRLYAIRVNGTILNNWTEADPPGCDSLVDVPTNGTETDTGVGGEVRGNYCTWNPLSGSPSYTYSNGNLDLAFDAVNDSHATTTITVTSGVWYCEGVLTAFGGSTVAGGFCVLDGSLQWNNANAGSSGRIEYRLSGGIIYNGSGVATVSSYGVGDVIGIWIDATNNQIKLYKNNVLQHTQSSVTFGSYMPGYYGNGGSGRTMSATINTGQRAFTYTAPSSSKALCTANLPTPTIEDGSAYMDATLYTGNGSTKTISGLGFSPDFVWIKRRNLASDHQLYDIVRGTNNGLSTNLPDDEWNYGNGLTSFNSDGFTLGDLGGANRLNDTHVAWTWDAGSSTVTNTDGSISSQVRANASAGFSIVGWNTGGSTSDFTVGHGLGVKPSMFIIKNRDAAQDWDTYFDGFASNEVIYLNTTAAKTNVGVTVWNSVTSTVLGLRGASFGGSASRIAYCFAPVEGYSAFGSYTGNGSTDGPFVYTGHRSKFVLIKSAGSEDRWTIQDTSRSPYNASTDTLAPNLSNAELASAFDLDILSNGFKVRNTNSGHNTSGVTYVWASFAENPFNYSRAR
jgi:hypothetical protein